jgi:hypothetical protein
MNIDNLTYVKRAPYRDASRIVIACEGALTEPNYFKHFEAASPKLTVTIAGKDAENPTLSAPKWVLARAEAHAEKVGLAEIDEVYLVMDVDHHEENDFRELHEICKKKNWMLVLSNPCFEVWPYMHFKEALPDARLKPQRLKYILSQLIQGGYHPEKILPYTERAIKNAVLLEKDADHFFPAENTTKVYVLVNRLISIMGKTYFQKLIQSKKDKPF